MHAQRRRGPLLILTTAALLVVTACMPAFPTPVAGPGWSYYSIAAGAHSAQVTRGAEATQPLAGFTSVSRRRYHFTFTNSMRYRITAPVQPEDQFDWNKLPGLSDCGDIDLSRNGYMFAWRWRLDTVPRVMEITAYANHGGTHITPPQPILTLTAEEIDSLAPLFFDLRIVENGSAYRFEVTQGPVGNEAVTRAVEIARNCPGSSLQVLKWASGLYFGGTSTAPTAMRGYINELR